MTHHLDLNPIFKNESGLLIDEALSSQSVIIQWKTPETVPPPFCKGRQLFQGFYIIFR